MRKNQFLFAILVSLSIISCSPKEEKIVLENETDSLSYGIGVSIAKDIKQQLNSVGLDSTINREALILGFKEFIDTTSIFTIQPEEAQEIVQAYFKKQEESQRAEYLTMHQGNLVAGQKFLEENKTKPGVMVLANGVQYKEIKKGWGEAPAATDTVLVHYHGTLIDGTVFDSSVERGQPVEFPVNGVIPGFSAALQSMKVGSKWIIYIPQELAYGTEVNPQGVIKPYSALIFEVELKKIANKSAVKKAVPSVNTNEGQPVQIQN
ncbi:MAG: FKBP-type peptidyl-prolyl cis-trans isomerase [Bacteroidales bacterium]|nr:FKBP-type peptidyl-prolyl cis-trans isomerase [Bacteroidales bacterium]